VSLSALLALANFADPPMGLNNDFSSFPVDPAYVKRGAGNAVEYLAAKYAFQSLRGKRQGPMRRSETYKKRINFLGNNEFVVMMSLLSGAYEWNDCSEGANCPVLGWNTYALVSSLTTMLSSSSGGFRIWPGTQSFMFERGPFFARMKTRYTDVHYPNLLASAWYFWDDSDTEAFDYGFSNSSVELHFGDDNILLSAGGTHRKYKAGNFWAKPTMLIPRGDFGLAWRDDTLKDVIEDVMVSPGRVWDWWESECNVWQYRNFVYGYRYHDRGATDSDLAPASFSRQHSFYVPEFWESTAADVRSFSIGDGHFEIYEFSEPSGLVPPSAVLFPPSPKGDGYFIVRARFRKYAARKALYKHREFSRGLLEIVPRKPGQNAEWLENEIVKWNDPSYFDGGDRLGSWRYVLTKSKERVHMGSEMGADRWGGEGCDDGILGLYEYDESIEDWVDAVDMEDLFIPPDIRDSDAMMRIPLITVWQLDENYQLTEPTCKLVETLKEGQVVIRQPKGTVCLDWSDAGLCLEWDEGWNCYKIDSHNYKFPSIQVDTSTNDCSCFSE
jgi:hypothetical protein